MQINENSKLMTQPEKKQIFKFMTLENQFTASSLAFKVNLGLKLF